MCRVLWEGNLVENSHLLKLRGPEARLITFCYHLGWYNPQASIARHLEWPTAGHWDFKVWLLWCMGFYLLFLVLLQQRRNHA